MDHNSRGNNCECPIWGTPAILSHPDGNIDTELYYYDSPRAGGKFVVSKQSLIELNDKISKNNSIRHKITTWIKSKQTSTEINGPNIDNSILEIIEKNKVLSFSQRRKMLFNFFISKNIEYQFILPNLVEDEESNENFNYEKYIDFCNFHLSYESKEPRGTDWKDFYKILFDQNYFIKSSETTERYFTFSAKYYEYIEKLQTEYVNSSNAFVAMWFSDETKQFYSEGVEIALEKCGYEKPFRVDKKHHSNKIDDEIIAMIMQSKLIIVDMTCGFVINTNNEKQYVPRGGVYYEAGYAKGLDRSVIWTCHKDCLSQLHFDIRQYNMLQWYEKENKIYLYDGGGEDEILFSKALEYRITVENLNLKIK